MANKYEGVTPQNNSIMIRFKVFGKDFRKTLKISPTAKNLRYASIERSKYMEQMNKGETPDDFKEAVPTVEYYLKKWLEYSEERLAKSSFRINCTHVTKLIEEFGSVPVDQFTLGMVRDWARSLSRNATSTNNVISILRGALNEALEDEVVTRNVLKGWSYTKARTVETKQYIQPLTSEEQQKLYAVLEPYRKNMFQFAMWTGLRICEYVALRWSDVDFKEGTISVNKGKLSIVNEITPTKTKGSNRVLKLLAPAMDALKAQRALTQLRGEEVFINERTNKAFTGSDQIHGIWGRALTKAKIPYRNAYQTRHTFASTMLTANEPPFWISSYMGHSNPHTLFKNYGKWIPDRDTTVGNKAVELYTTSLKSGAESSTL